MMSPRRYMPFGTASASDMAGKIHFPEITIRTKPPTNVASAASVRRSRKRPPQVPSAVNYPDWAGRHPDVARLAGQSARFRADALDDSVKSGTSSRKAGGVPPPTEPGREV